MDKVHKKIIIEIEQGADGYPPVSIESVWASKTEKKNEFIIDNIPIYAYGISLGDKVKVTFKTNEFHFQEVIEKSGNSTLRVYCPIENLRSLIQEELISIGCHIEVSNIINLFSVSIPGSTSINQTIEIVEKFKLNCEDIEYEEACIQHN